jgi:hypothetical protein
MAQNLVPNGDFELYTSCPTAEAQIDSALFWTNPASYGTPDYFNTCAPVSSWVNVPDAAFGYQNAQSGDAFAGIFVYVDAFQSGREYIGTSLTSPLSPNTCYFFEMYLSSADNLKFSSDNIGVYFSTTVISMHDTMPMTFAPQISNPQGVFIDTINWRHFADTYWASGGEQFIVIGNFAPVGAVNTIVQNPLSQDARAYFYIDNILLTPCVNIMDVETNYKISIHPNPFSEKLTIKSEMNYPFEFGLYDVLGNVYHMTKSNNNIEIDTRSLSSGVYFYKLVCANNFSKVGKLIKR